MCVWCLGEAGEVCWKRVPEARGRRGWASGLLIRQCRGERSKGLPPHDPSQPLRTFDGLKEENLRSHRAGDGVGCRRFGVGLGRVLGLENQKFRSNDGRLQGPNRLVWSINTTDTALLSNQVVLIHNRAEAQNSNASNQGTNPSGAPRGLGESVSWSYRGRVDERRRVQEQTTGTSRNFQIRHIGAPNVVPHM